MSDPFDALYRERSHLLALLATHYPAHLQPDPAQRSWSVLYLSLPTGQCTWHISEEDLDLFEHVRTDITEVWDGHTTAQKYGRVDELTDLRGRDPW